ncbi:adenine nucleotide alpha hydrolases-like protein [Nadsonia fulvescens var. elongata DSM 6958]|uniref:FAD synthase n=1 Tax=Nadsonia fulvescens var. elongata DSM 6958 TaxID=857566 RepID=A0A1E3PFQ2_9ASCO|nr:adenine nucleotide alpha hydrolases-like protein [Nadsonia fulvescens var. elongata DSM 6958]
MPYTEPWTARSLAEACQHCHRLVMGFLASEDTETKWRLSTKKKVHEAIGVINQALDSYSLDEMVFSFNGGKDCLVMLIIFLAVLHIRSTSMQLPNRLSTVYVHSECAFDEVDEFVAHCNDQYFLSPTSLSGPLKQAFASYLADHPETKAVVVGIRRTDPYGENLTPMARTDHGWPDFMRIHPVLNWNLAEIWDFIKWPIPVSTWVVSSPNSSNSKISTTAAQAPPLSLQKDSNIVSNYSQPSLVSSILTVSSATPTSSFIAYCKLYDLGYTSLGGTNNTFKNPSLKSIDSKGQITYKPAYVMEDDDKERIGRC